MGERSKLAWRCRRGTLELDLMLKRFLDLEYDRANEAEKNAFATLLEDQDPQIQRYLMGKENPADEAIANIVKRIRTLSES